MNNTHFGWVFPHLWHGAEEADHASQDLQVGRARHNEEHHKQDCSHECTAEGIDHVEGSKDEAQYLKYLHLGEHKEW